MRLTQLMKAQPYQTGTVRRTGAAGSRGSGDPLIPTASSSRDRSSLEKIQLAPGVDVFPGSVSSSSPDTRMRDPDSADDDATPSTKSRSGTPSQSAVLS